MRKVLAMMVLAGCAASGAPDAPAPDRLTRIAAECTLLARAHAQTAAQGARAWPDILEGCPTHPDARSEMTMAQMSNATRAANALSTPPGLSPRADQVLRRMVTRGVPPEVALTLVQSPEFAAAIR